MSGIVLENFLDGQTRIVLKQWYHVAQTSDGNSLKLYVNGQYESPLYISSVNDGTINSSQPLRIGGGAPSGTPPFWFAGVIDDIRIYNRALSEAEIKQLYQLSSVPTPTSIKTYEDGLNEGIAKCQNDPASCGITVPPESGNCPSVDTHASFSPSNGVLTIPAVDVPDIFGGVTTYRAEMSLIAGEGLVFSVTNAEPVQ